MKYAREIFVVVATLVLGVSSTVAAKPPLTCPAGLERRGSQPLTHITVVPPVQTCTVRMSHGYPLPDPHCTPGAVNSSVDVAMLQDPAFKTPCVRDQTSSPGQKAGTYKPYGVPHPANNRASTQTCELDHLVSLELGGADSLDNIWPQCGPAGVALNARYFKRKDKVENYLAAMVEAGKIDLATAQAGIATDWTQYLEAAGEWSAAHGHAGGK